MCARSERGGGRAPRPRRRGRITVADATQRHLVCSGDRVRRPRLFAGSIALILALTSTLALGSGVRAATPVSSGPFFRLSRIQAVSPAQSATRYSVTVTNAPIGNTPYARWYLELKPPARQHLPAPTSFVRAVSSSRRTGLAGKPGDVVCLGSRRQGRLRADRSYGATNRASDTTAIRARSRSSSRTTRNTAPRPSQGRPRAPARVRPRPVCALGGYIPIPVPLQAAAALLEVDEH